MLRSETLEGELTQAIISLIFYDNIMEIICSCSIFSDKENIQFDIDHDTKEDVEK